jgi:peptidoglycan/LPS O-acetylase OafA/YrhL
MTSEITSPAVPTHHDRRRIRWWHAVAAGAAAAVVINLLLLAVAAAGGAALAVAQDGSQHPVTAAGVVVASLVPLLIGTVLAVLLSRRWPRVLRVAQVVAAAAAVLTTFGPLSGAVDTATGVVLATMHLTVGAAAVGILETARRTRQT